MPWARNSCSITLERGSRHRAPRLLHPGLDSGGLRSESTILWLRSCMASSRGQQRLLAGLIVWPGLKSLPGPAAVCKLNSSRPEGQPPSPGSHWPSQPAALEKLVPCKTYLLRYREKAILHLITSIRRYPERWGPCVRRQSKGERDASARLAKFQTPSREAAWSK